jgi:thiamine-phosphate pyrophosphorylase
MTFRADRLAGARLYLVCDAARSEEHLDALLEGALLGGVDLIQLRDKEADDDRLLEAAPAFRAAADRHGALFLINDRPDMVAACRADGVHVGQDDTGVAEARRLAGPDAIVGLSSHGPAQLDAAERADGDSRPDYLSVGPVWATPTKPGRPAAGLDYVRYAAANASIPWFAIGGIDSANLAGVRAAGAARVVVVRAIADAPDPEAAARALVDALGPSPAAVAATR